MSKIGDFFIIILIFAIVIASFFFQNNHEVVFSLFGTKFAISLGYLVGGFSIFSFCLGLFYAISSWLKNRKYQKGLLSQINDLERQIDGMKLSLETLSNNIVQKSAPAMIEAESNINSKLIPQKTFVEEAKTDTNIVDDVLKELNSNQ